MSEPRELVEQHTGHLPNVSTTACPACVQRPPGRRLVFEVCLHCEHTINPGGLCSYECPHDAGLHDGMKATVIYEPVGVVR